MDYSLLLAVLVLPYDRYINGQLTRLEALVVRSARYTCVVPSSAPNSNGKRRRRFLHVYFMGIIDYLQEWTMTKRVARCIKCLAPKPMSTVPPDAYAQQFLQCFAHKFRADATECKTPYTHRHVHVDLDEQDTRLCHEFLSILDQDNNGTIEVGEAVEILPKVLRPDLFLKHLDRDNDNKVSFEEVMQWFKGLKQREPHPGGSKILLTAIIKLTKKELKVGEFENYMEDLKHNAEGCLSPQLRMPRKSVYQKTTPVMTYDGREASIEMLPRPTQPAQATDHITLTGTDSKATLHTRRGDVTRPLVNADENNEISVERTPEFKRVSTMHGLQSEGAPIWWAKTPRGSQVRRPKASHVVQVKMDQEEHKPTVVQPLPDAS